MRRILFLISFSCLVTVLSGQPREIDLTESVWTFHEAGDTLKLPAVVPGTIHTDLLANGLIDDPFFGNNEPSLQWIEGKTWVYETHFQLSGADIRGKRIDLIFEGLDTYADVRLNGKSVLKANNMFRQWEVDAKPFLISGINHIEITFHPAADSGKKLAAQLPYALPGGEQVMVRKPAYHFGWDWAPRFVTCGIWKDVKIRINNGIRIEHFDITQVSVSDTLAKLKVVVSVENFTGKKAMVTAYAAGASNSKTISGLQSADFEFTVRNPERWWCNGMGKPHLYTIQIELFQGKSKVDSAQMDIGLRTVELIQEPDSAGRAFYFRLNGKPVFAKGANLIPFDVFLPRITRADYEQIISYALDANMNMVRVWGGGVYEQDIFYDLCDRAGLMVWQDFMFGGGMFPGDSSFMENVAIEISQQVARLKYHPSIVLWCGNNEADEGWHNWGWQKRFGYSPEDSSKIYTDYQHLFGKVIPAVLSTIDDRPYHPSSPTTGWGRKESLQQGDVHYWGIWWGLEPFEKYREKVGRFVSEFGFQGIPSTYSRFLPQDEQYLESISFKNHQKHPIGFETIERYLEKDYRKPPGLAGYAYISQLLQAKGIKTAIEAHRKARPYCMGSLFWQLNDCWPVVSWSSVDYYGAPKAVHYAVKRAFHPYLIVIEEDEQKMEVYISADKDVTGKLVNRLVDFEGNILYTDSLEVSVNGGATQLVHRIPLDKVLFNTAQSLMKSQFFSGETLLAEQICYFEKPVFLEMKPSTLTLQWQNDSTLKVHCDGYLAKDIWLQSEGVVFSDNFFDLLPGETKLVTARSRAMSRPSVEVRTFLDAYKE